MLGQACLNKQCSPKSDSSSRICLIMVDTISILSTENNTKRQGSDFVHTQMWQNEIYGRKLIGDLHDALIDNSVRNFKSIN